MESTPGGGWNIVVSVQHTQAQPEIYRVVLSTCDVEQTASRHRGGVVSTCPKTVRFTGCRPQS